MPDVAAIVGLANVLRNAKRRHDQLLFGMQRGLKLAGLKLQRESQLLAPVEFGPLEASAFTRAVGEGWHMKVLVGYTALYALYVHEQVGMKLKGKPRRPNPPHKGKYWDPQGRAQAKFLEAPARLLAPRLRQIILNQMRIR